MIIMDYITSVYVPVPNSSSINSFGWIKDKDTGTLTITFKNDSVYEYDDVPLSVVNDMIEQESTGSYFHKYIRDNFNTRSIS